MNYASHIVHINDIDLHYIEYGEGKMPLLMMHGLTANAHAFDGFMRAGLAENRHVLSIDFRGRGLSTKTTFDYSIEAHANDVIALLNYLDIACVDICGHSFGGLMATYIAYHYPERVRKIIILDAAPKMNPKAAEMLAPALSRLSLRFNSLKDYVQKVKKAPYITFWDDAMYTYYRADIHPNKQGTYETWSSLADITQIAINTSVEPWAKYFENIPHEILLIHATENYTLNQLLITEDQALKAVASMKHGHYQPSLGNHQTMLYGVNAKSNVTVINKYLLAK